MKGQDIRFARLLLLVNGAVTLALLGWDVIHHRLGTYPQKDAIHTTGMMALTFLMLTMAVTPVRRITGWNWLLLLRRTLGLLPSSMQVKADVRRPLVFAAVLSILLGYRLLV